MSQIAAKIIADSVYTTRLTTMELEYPRFIHAEFMTHRVFSRGSASSRAIPIKQVIWQVITDPAMPIHWGRTQPGMQARRELGTVKRTIARGLWRTAGIVAAGFATLMWGLGLHKQVANRILEPWQVMKVVCTSMEWDNFFTLRDHPDAQPEIRELAYRMKQALLGSTPNVLEEGHWHLPYADANLPVKTALKVSASCCAQVSYRKLDDSIEKAERIFDMLIKADVMHASPLEHQAYAAPSSVHSGNFRGWVQHRKIIEGGRND